MNSRILLFVILTLCPMLAIAGVYKHVDEKGNVTYSNVPTGDAQKVNLPPLVVVPSTSSREIDNRIQQRRENNKIQEHRSQLEGRIAEETQRLNEVKDEYKGGTPDRLGSERNYQRYLNRVERLKAEIDVRERNLDLLRKELQGVPQVQRIRP